MEDRRIGHRRAPVPTIKTKTYTPPSCMFACYRTYINSGLVYLCFSFSGMRLAQIFVYPYRFSCPSIRLHASSLTNCEINFIPFFVQEIIYMMLSFARVRPLRTLAIVAL